MARSARSRIYASSPCRSRGAASFVSVVISESLREQQLRRDDVAAAVDVADQPRSPQLAQVRAEGARVVADPDRARELLAAHRLRVAGDDLLEHARGRAAQL